jgi:hypothetical protein
MVSGVPFLPAKVIAGLRSAVWPTDGDRWAALMFARLWRGGGETEASAPDVLSVALQLGL